MNNDGEIEPLVKEVDSQLHRVWTAHVGCSVYDKKAFQELERKIWNLIASWRERGQTLDELKSLAMSIKEELRENQ